MWAAQHSVGLCVTGSAVYQAGLCCHSHLRCQAQYCKGSTPIHVTHDSTSGSSGWMHSSRLEASLPPVVSSVTAGNCQKQQMTQDSPRRRPEGNLALPSISHPLLDLHETQRVAVGNSRTSVSPPGDRINHRWQVQLASRASRSGVIRSTATYIA
jgi:hypothetical protein